MRETHKERISSAVVSISRLFKGSLRIMAGKGNPVVSSFNFFKTTCRSSFSVFCCSLSPGDDNCKISCSDSAPCDIHEKYDVIVELENCFIKG